MRLLLSNSVLAGNQIRGFPRDLGASHCFIAPSSRIFGQGGVWGAGSSRLCSFPYPLSELFWSAHMRSEQRPLEHDAGWQQEVLNNTVPLGLYGDTWE